MDPGLPQWLTSAGVIGALALVLGLWLRGVLLRAKDCDDKIAALKDAHATELDLIQDAHADTLTALNLAHSNRSKLLQQRLDALIADRDAWRAAHTDESAARRSAEQSTRQLLESSNITMALLSALKDSLARTPPHDQGDDT